MALSDAVLSVIPEAYRRDFIVLGIGLAIGSGWWHFETRIDTAYAAAKETPQMQSKIDTLEGQSATNQSNILAIKTELDNLTVHLIGTVPPPTAPPVATIPPRATAAKPKPGGL